MSKLSAALLAHRVNSASGVLEVLIVHPGGPFWARKDLGAWSIPKGEYEDGEDPQEVARREFGEEVGVAVPAPELTELAKIKQPSGKVITAYHVRTDLDLKDFHSNTFEMEWPKGSGRTQEFPEVDRAGWFELAEARRRLIKGQVPFLDELVARLQEAGEPIVEGTDAAPSEEPQASLF
jgi:predicted NUDIX family NTP pyrophosphohydrolase